MCVRVSQEAKDAPGAAGGGQWWTTEGVRGAQLCMGFDIIDHPISLCGPNYMSEALGYSHPLDFNANRNVFGIILLNCADVAILLESFGNRRCFSIAGLNK